MAAKKKSATKFRGKRGKKVEAAQPKPESNVRNAFFGLLVLFLFALGFYSIQTYNKTEIETVTVPGIEHIHAALEVTICSKKFDLPKDAGDLENSHTHKEENLLHWHAKPGNENNRNLKNIEIQLLKGKIPQICTKGVPAKRNLTVNGEKQADPENYIWKDGDKLELTYE